MMTKSIWVAVRMGEEGRKVLIAEIRLDQERAMLMTDDGHLTAVESNDKVTLGRLLAIGPNPENLVTALCLSQDAVVLLPVQIKKPGNSLKELTGIISMEAAEGGQE